MGRFGHFGNLLLICFELFRFLFQILEMVLINSKLFFNFIFFGTSHLVHQCFDLIDASLKPVALLSCRHG